MTRLARTLGFTFILALGLFAAPARAQEPAPAGTEQEGNPVPGYIATGMLCAATMFVLCKSARR
jgi:hypothetical protein